MYFGMSQLVRLKLMAISRRMKLNYYDSIIFSLSLTSNKSQQQHVFTGDTINIWS